MYAVPSRWGVDHFLRRQDVVYNVNVHISLELLHQRSMTVLVLTRSKVLAIVIPKLALLLNFLTTIFTIFHTTAEHSHWNFIKKE